MSGHPLSPPDVSADRPHVSPPHISPPRVPAEWEPQAAVWLAWPHQRSTWPGRFRPVPEFFTRWARIIAESTPVKILAGGELAADAGRAFRQQPLIDVVDIATNDCWIRDYGPTFVVHRDRSLGSEDRPRETLEAVAWRYNAWGGKYPPWDLDDAAATRIADHLRIPTIRGELCLEGGALETDGQGRLLTTPGCLVTDTRNPGRSTEDVARELHRRLGIGEIVWLDGGGLQGDDTDGHIDQLARFLSPEIVVVAVCDDPEDPNHGPLEANYHQLRLWAGTTKPRVEVHRLPIPPARHIDGQRVPESYCNFLRLGADRLLVPTFGDPAADDRAVGILRGLTDRVEVTPIDCRDLVWGLGALHCASRDQPRTDL